MSDDPSAGIISIEIKGLSTQATVKKLIEKKVAATAPPYKTSWVRFTPGLINFEKEIDKAMEILHSLKQ